MTIRDENFDLISEGHLHYLRNISIDNVIFAYHQEELHVLLYFHPVGEWAITGGFIGRKETLDEAAFRIANKPVGLDNFYFKQFKAFGGEDRLGSKNTFAKQMNATLSSDEQKIPDDNWLNEYFITIGFYSLVEYSKVNLHKGGELKHRWWKIDNLPSLLADHKKIVDCALNYLREDLNKSPIAKELLPKKFTLPELHTMYEIIQGKKLDRGNFYKRMKASGWLLKLYEQKETGAHRSPYLHMFNPEI